MGISSLGQAIELDIGSAHHAGLIKFDNTFEVPAGASNGGSQRRHVSTLWFWRLRPRSDEGRAAAWFEHREGLLCNVAPDGVKNSVAIGYGLREVPGIVVDDFIGAENLSHMRGSPRSPS